MKVSEIYSTCLKAADLGGQDVVVTIAGGEVRVMDDGKRKLFLQLQETSAPLSLNVTNAKMLSRLLGEEATAWKGKRVTLYPTTTQFAGREVDCIRIRDRLPEPPESTQSAAPKNGAVRF